MNLRYVLLIMLSILFWRHGQAQYPTAGVKQRLGYQTTGDGLVYRGNGTPSYTPSGLNSAWAYIDTTAGTIYTFYAGSWHLVSAGGGTSFDGHVDSLVFNTAVTVVDSTAKMYWDANSETISVGVDGGAVYQLGQELYYPLVINKSGATIHNGQPVMVDTATLTTGDHVRVMPAKNNGILPSNYIMGVATTDIPDDSTGLVTWFGYVREVKESDVAQSGVTFTKGDILYISATQAGKYTNVAPSTPYHRSTIALVARRPNANNLTLLVRPWLAPRLADLSDVNTSSVTGLSVLRYNSSAGTWDASATAGIVAADTAAMLAPYVNVADTASMMNAYPRGSATSGQVAYWNGTRSLAGSNGLYYDNTNKRLYLDYAAYRDTYYGKYGIFHNYDFSIQSNITDPTNITLQAGGGFTYGAGSIIFSTMPNTREIARFTFATSGEHRRLGIGTSDPQYTIDANTSVGIRLPVGTYAQRPTGAAGVLRFNSDSTGLEYHNGTSWRGIVNTWDASATAGIVAADTAAMLSNYVTLGTSQTITGTKTISNLLHRISGFTQDSFRLDYAAWPVSASQRIPYTISKGSGYYPSTGAMSTFMSRLNWGAVSDYNNASAFVFIGTDASGTGTLSNAAIAEYWNQYNSKALRIMANGRMAFGNFAPSYSLDMYGKTDGIRLPVGTTGQQPTGAAGVLRYNSTNTALEYHTGTSWQTVATTASTAQTHYFALNTYDYGVTLANTTASGSFFVVPSNLNGYCIENFTAKALAGSGTADIQIAKNGSGSSAQSISGTTAGTKDVNITLATGDVIIGQVFNLSAGATLAGLGITLEIKASCN